MQTRYSHLELSGMELAHRIRIQVMAFFKPNKFPDPDELEPKNSFDKHVIKLLKRKENKK